MTPSKSTLHSLPWSRFLADQQLPDSFRQQAERWFTPLVETVIARRRLVDGPLWVGVNGSQGSGKSTLAAFLASALPAAAGLRVCVMSLDDFYLTRTEREQLADTVHPLLRTRGVPGTHDTALMHRVFTALREGPFPVALPIFDKSVDDRCAETDWHLEMAPPDVVVWEGWCLGVPPQPASALQTPVNTLERTQDADGRWRRLVNQTLADAYQPLFDVIDLWVMLAAPNFDCVHRWRLEQEEKLALRVGSDAPCLMSSQQIADFIQYYQRLTEWGRDSLPSRVDFLYRLAEDRRIQSLAQRDGEGSL